MTALDGSKQIETVEITVLNDLIITNKYVDTDNEVIILDKTVGNLYIDSSVGNADIYLGGVTVRNILAMDSGDYSLYMYDSTANELKIDEIPGEIESFATDEEKAKAPKLTLGENTTIKELNARISESIRQDVVQSIEITIDITNAEAVSGTSIGVETLMQNKVGDKWDGSYKLASHNTELSIINSPYTVERNIIIDSESWNTEDTMVGKLYAKLTNIKDLTTPQAKITIKIVSRAID